MSALPEQALHPLKPSQVLIDAIENPDNTILSDEQLFKLKGGNEFLLAKIGIGLGTALSIIGLENLRKLHIPFGVFFWANAVAVLTMTVSQSVYLRQSGGYDRYRAHRLALYHRYILNFAEINENKKKPRYH